jgi:hypothetical protein
LKPQHTLQQILQSCDLQGRENTFTSGVLSKLRNCRTSVMGYHYYQCDNPDCTHVHYQYHACRNRHCPQCNWQKQEEWMEARTNELLPVKYYHVVFTLPHELNALVMGNRVKLFKLLFDSASHCLLTLSSDPKWMGGMPSITAVLQTWDKQLNFHPHVHCIVSGGGVDKELKWVKLKKETKQGFLFPRDVMEPMFKKHFMRNLKRMIMNGEIAIKDKAGWEKLKEHLYKTYWNLYAKAPMGGVSQVVEYLAGYVHKVAIGNHRILEVTDKRVRFQYTDKKDNYKIKQMWLTIDEFIRRFEQHILPKGFVKMRHYGILGNFKRKKRVNDILHKMKLPPHPPTVKIPYQLRLLEKFGVDVNLCPACKLGHLELVQKVFPHNRGSPLLKLKTIPDEFIAL